MGLRSVGQLAQLQMHYTSVAGLSDHPEKNVSRSSFHSQSQYQPPGNMHVCTCGSVNRARK